MSWSDENEVIDNWEDLDQTDFDAKLDFMIKSKKNETKNTKNLNVVMINEDAYCSQYVPKAPVVKILKRPAPNQDGRSGLSDAANAKSKPVPKTLQQREQEYAEARIRILGVDRQQLVNATDLTLPNNIINKKKDESNADKDNLLSIKRLPKGPDGTKGFHKLRS